MNVKRWLTDYVPLILIWLGLVLLFGLLSENFLTSRTLVTLASQVPPLAIIACGMTLVLIIAGIDLSVGSTLALASAMLGVALVDWGLPLLVACLVAIVTGGMVGLFNGLVSVYLRIPSFIVTLGTLEIARGLSYLATDSQTKYLGTSLESLARPMPGIGIPLSFVIAVVVVLVGQFVLTRTAFGRYLIAIGTNENAVRLAGVPTALKKTLVFVIIGMLTGLAAIFFTARLGSSDPNAGVGLELSAIAAVVIGGTSLMGGRGSIINSFVGVLIIATLGAGLAQIGASEPSKRVVTGLVIVLAVTIDALRGDFIAKLKSRFRTAQVP
ncbi:MAG: ABC transporter permease [Verrucomicrobiae bacterium]|nr:ABC transporter permease [Verrucomicrobiae bacterium]